MNDRIKKLRDWLRGNVISPPTPKRITLSNIHFDPFEIKGTFNLSLDNVRFTQTFDFFVDISGKYEFTTPLHVSPMGAPASYPSIELTEETKLFISKLLNNFLPKIKPYGLDKETGGFIDSSSHMKVRIFNEDELNWVIEEISSQNFELSGLLEK